MALSLETRGRSEQPDKATNRVGFVGLGVMGSRMAKNLLRSGYDVVVYNRSPGPMEELMRAGASAARSPKEIAEQCRITVMALLDSKAVEQIVLGERGLSEGAHPGSILIDTSTIDPEASAAIARRLKEKDVYLLDAPVSGGPEGAAAATLSIMVGGQRAAFESARDVLSRMGKSVFYLGESGSGLRMKLFNQALVGVYFVAVAEAYVWAEKTGLKIEDIQKIISMSWGDSPVFRHFAAAVSSGDMKGGASMRNLKKDLSIILESAGKDGVQLTFVKLADRYLSAAVAEGYEDYDTSMLYKLLDAVQNDRTD